MVPLDYSYNVKHTDNKVVEEFEKGKGRSQSLIKRL